MRVFIPTLLRLITRPVDIGAKHLPSFNGGKCPQMARPMNLHASRNRHLATRAHYILEHLRTFAYYDLVAIEDLGLE